MPTEAPKSFTNLDHESNKEAKRGGEKVATLTSPCVESVSRKGRSCCIKTSMIIQLTSCIQQHAHRTFNTSSMFNILPLYTFYNDDSFVTLDARSTRRTNAITRRIKADDAGGCWLGGLDAEHTLHTHACVLLWKLIGLTEVNWDHHFKQNKNVSCKGVLSFFLFDSCAVKISTALLLRWFEHCSRRMNADILCRSHHPRDQDTFHSKSKPVFHQVQFA